ncbi:hypothetical protein [Idiomarina loihiensis]|uniref:hypothetical protein n=1 Tax=Idiomarina loihiensis TaxID=135577 RepID=UPI00384A679E
MSELIIEERRLVVYINDDIVGELREQNGLWAFEYALDWLSKPNAFPLKFNSKQMDLLRR